MEGRIGNSPRASRPRGLSGTGGARQLVLNELRLIILVEVGIHGNPRDRS